MRMPKKLKTRLPNITRESGYIELRYSVSDFLRDIETGYHI